MTLDQFVKSLAQSGVLSPEEFAQLEAAFPAAKRPKEVSAFAKELVAAGRLTRYQAAAIYQNQAGSLLFGEYVVLDRLGAGGMGHVFKARHKRMKRTVALKVLPLKAMRAERAVQRFYQEVCTAAQLLHPNIVTAYDAGEAGGLHFLAMELVDGRDLSVILKDQKRLPPDKAVNYILQAARGLEFAHGQGIIHRDIKPSNLLLDKKGVIKILDMGLARVSDAQSDANDAAAQGLTQQGEIMGTVDYMAPEQMQDSHSADHRADIFSLGCTLYNLLTGSVPFKGDTLVRKMLARLEQPIPTLSAECQGVPPQLDGIFRRMVDKDPAQRFQSMTELAAALESSGAPVAADAAPAESVIYEEPAADDAGLSKFLDGMDVSPRSQLARGPALPKGKPKADEKSSRTARRGTTPKKAPIALPKVSSKVLIGGGVAAAVVLLAVGVWLLGSSPKQPPVAKTPDGESVQTVEGESQPETTGDPSGASPTQTFPGVSRGGPVETGGGGPAVGTSNAPSKAGAPLTKPVDLLALIDPLEDAVHGVWTKFGGQLVSPAGTQYARLQPKFVPPEEYVLEAVVQRTSGKPEALGLGVVVGGSLTRILIDAKSGTTTGLDLLDNQRFDANETTRHGAVFKESRPYTVKAAVRKNSLLVTCDGQTLVDWSGDAARLSLMVATVPMPSWERLFVNSQLASYTFHKLEVRPLTPQDAVAPAPVPAIYSAVDLLPLLDPTKPVTGVWTRTDKDLLAEYSAQSRSARLNINLMPPKEYTLTVVAQRESGDDALGLGICVDGMPVTVNFDSDQGKWSGLEPIDGRRANVNETSYKSPVFVNSQPRTIVCKVRKDAVEVTCDGQKIIDWHGDAKRLGGPGGMPLPPKDRFNLVTHLSNYRFYKLELAPLDAAPSAAPVIATTITPTAGPTAPTTPSTSTSTDPSTAARAPAKLETIDLLAKIDPARDAVSGAWKKVERGLVGPAGNAALYPTLQIPFHPPAEFRLEMTVTRAAGTGHLIVGLFVKEIPVLLVLDRKEESCLIRVDGRDRDNASAVRRPVFTDNVPCAIVCEVRNSGISVTADGRPLLDWKDISRLSAHNLRKIPDPEAMSIGTADSHILFSKIELTPLDSAAEQKIEKVPPPVAGATLAGLDVLKSQLEGLYKSANSVDGVKALVDAVRREARKPRNEPGLRYAAHQEIVRLGAENSDFELALAAIGDMARDFEIDRDKVELETIDAIFSAAKTTPARKQVVDNSLAFVEQATSDDRYGVAWLVHQQALTTTLGKLRDPVILKELRARDVVLKEWDKLSQSAVAAEEKLKSEAGDQAAQTTLGSYQCFLRGDWTTGLPHLAQGNDAALKKAAELEAAVPTEPGPRLALAEAWWVVGEKAPPATKFAMLERAEYWFRRAMPRLEGASATKAQQRLIKIEELQKAAPTLFAKRHPVDAVAFNGHWYKVYVDMRSWHEARKACDDLGGYLVCLETADEQAFVARLVSQHVPPLTEVWLGLSDEEKEGDFRWVNGSPLTHQIWEPAQPSNTGNNEHYATLRDLRSGTFTGKWNDVPSSKRTPYVCEWGK